MIFTDANAWLGSELLQNDPHNQNMNGKLFHEFMVRNPELKILNCESLCEGVITRSRIANGKTEKSVIDFVIISDKLLPFVDKFLIDEKKLYALSNYSKRDKVLHSDHNSLITSLNLYYDFQKPEKRTIFNFRDEIAMTKFKRKTSHDGIFTNIFRTKAPFKNKITKWVRTLKRTIFGCFKKVRLSVKGKKFKLCKNFNKGKRPF